MSAASFVTFQNFCQLCSKISETHRERKAKELQNYIQSWKRKAQDWEKYDPTIDCSFYPVLRLLLPHLDRERGAYGVKEYTLAKIYIRILSLPKEGSDAIKLLEYRGPNRSNNIGDFADVAYWILKKRCFKGGQLSIEDVNNHLDMIATKHASNDPRGVDSELISLLKETNAEEQKWIIRILLKEMKLGIGQGLILNTYHPDGKDLYEANYNLKKVCEVLKDTKVRLNEIEIELFSPLRPMLAEECYLEKLDDCFQKPSYFYIETKLDGERFQFHKKEGDYKYFSRNGYDYTAKFGKTRFEGILTPRIADQFQDGVNSCILDGEMMCWNSETETFVSKGNNIDVKNLKEGDIYKPCFCVFDVLLYNGKVITNQPLCWRLSILNKIINPLKGVICFVSRKFAYTTEEIVACLNAAIDNREEGIIMKRFLSIYKPNARVKGGWYKVKPEYIDGLSDTLDLLILGGYFGSGRHEGKISHFLLGVAVSVEDDDSFLFYSVSRVGSGYSISELSELQNKLSPHWQSTKSGEMPPGIEWSKEKPDVWIPPAKSYILEVRAAEITSSNLFRTGYTLRFPRVEKVRYDKLWKNCLTLEEFEEKRKMASGKLFSHHVTSVRDKSNEKKKKSPGTGTKLGKQFRGIDTSKVEVVSNLLAGKKICVLSGFGKTTKKAVERRIVEFGGSINQCPGRNLFCILAETESTIRIKNAIKSGNYDLIRTSWFYSQLNVENSSLPQFKPINFLAMSRRTKEIFLKSYDEFGDHYIAPLTDDSLKELMATIKCGSTSLSIDDKHNIDVELFSGPSPYSLFRLCNAYFDRFPQIGNPSSGLLPELEIDELCLKFYGGRCSEKINNETTHIVLFSGDLTRLKEFNRINSIRRRKFHIVTEQWVQSSIRTKSLASDCGYLSELCGR